MTEKKSKKLGSELKSIREKQGMTLEEIALRTKINIKYLSAIENDEFDFLHTPYVLAFVKAYAKILGLDLNEITETFNDHIRAELDFSIQEDSNVISDTPAMTITESPAESTSPQTVTPVPQSDRSKPLIVGGLIVVLIVSVFLFQKFFSTADEAEPVPASIPSARQETPVDTTADSVQANPVVPEQITMSLAATDSIWFRVQVDTLAPREYIFTPGDSQTWNADDRFELRTGKSTGIRVYLNGDRIGNLGNDSTLIWRLVLTRDGVEERSLRLR